MVSIDSCINITNQLCQRFLSQLFCNWISNCNVTKETDFFCLLSISISNIFLFRNLYNEKLSGSLASEIGSLSDLSSLELGRNTLHQSIPAQFGLLTKLGKLDLSTNKLGSFVDWFVCLNDWLICFMMIWLEQKWLSCVIVGSIPAEFMFLTSLTYLKLNDNLLVNAIISNYSKLNFSRRVRLEEFPRFAVHWRHARWAIRLSRQTVLPVELVLLVACKCDIIV